MEFHYNGGGGWNYNIFPNSSLPYSSYAATGLPEAQAGLKAPVLALPQHQVIFS